MEVQIRQISCSNMQACITAIALKFEGSELVVQAPEAIEEQPLFVLDGAQISWDTALSHGYQITAPTAGIYVIMGPSNFKMELQTQGIYFRVQLSVTVTYTTYGICGPALVSDDSCNDPENDPECVLRNYGPVSYHRYHGIDRRIIIGYCGRYRLSIVDSIIYKTFMEGPLRITWLLRYRRLVATAFTSVVVVSQHYLFHQEALHPVDRAPFSSIVAPVWQPSDIPVTPVSVVDIEFTTVIEFGCPELEEAARESCNYLLRSGPIFDACHSLQSELDNAYHECLETIAITSQDHRGMDVALAFSYECQAQLDLDDWPGRGLCGLLPGLYHLGYGGDDCSDRCNYGVFTAGSCHCFNGYWGAHCDQLCVTNDDTGVPCGGRGECNQYSGGCLCLEQWRGNDNCTSCSMGWDGADCTTSVIVLPPESDIFTCSVRATTLVNFEGVAYQMRTEGIYRLTNNSDMDIQISRRREGELEMSVDAIGFGIGAVGITIRSTLNFQSVVHINGQQESLDEIFTIDSESSLRKVSSTSYELNDAPLRLVRYQYRRYLIRRSCRLPADIFPGDGNLGFGVWVPPLLGSGVIPDGPFTGAIDDIRVWDRYFDGNAVLNLRDRLSAPPDGLRNHWSCDEGEGYEAGDSIGGSHMPLTNIGSNSPEWILSDVPLPPLALPEDLSLNPEDLLPWIKDFCYAVILSGPIDEHCHLGEPSSLRYYQQCLDDVFRANSTDAA
ncbi:hypothetical protein BSL78_01938 [Apostichopus japonicus]|uniref:EGF-like domain-containing protein n=1 Tax=Stichopus japonicus TaxID=307972 RepID=A0A2G8LLJ3_STIJA|nr:hypothetical protein BSL78_01938 [Apostichopus japonicus]